MSTFMLRGAVPRLAQTEGGVASVSNGSRRGQSGQNAAQGQVLTCRKPGWSHARRVTFQGGAGQPTGRGIAGTGEDGGGNAAAAGGNGRHGLDVEDHRADGGANALRGEYRGDPACSDGD